MKQLLMYTGAASLLLFTACKSGKKVEIKLEENPQYETANIKPFTDALRKNPQDPALWTRRADALNKADLDSLALKDYIQALELDSSKAPAWSNVGNLMFENKDVSGSLPYFQSALKINPKDQQSQLKIAKVMVFIKDYTKAFMAINTALRQNVYNSEAYFLKGIIYKDLKDTAKSISSFQTAVQVDPDNAEALLQLGFWYEAKKDPIALMYYQNAYQADTNNLQPLYAKGMYYQNKEQYDEAKNVYHNILSHRKDFPLAHYNLGWIYLQQDSLQKAYNAFDLVTQLAPGYAEAIYNRGLCSELMGKKTEAITDYEHAVAVDPEMPEAIAALKRLGKK